MMMSGLSLQPSSTQHMMAAPQGLSQGITGRYGGGFYHQAAADVFVSGGAKALGYTPTVAESVLRSVKNIFPKISDMLSALVGGRVGYDMGRSVATTAQLSEQQTLAAGVIGGVSGASIGLKFSRWLKHHFGADMFKALKNTVIGNH
jgi:hypothetical protein